MMFVLFFFLSPAQKDVVCSSRGGMLKGLSLTIASHSTLTMGSVLLAEECSLGALVTPCTWVWHELNCDLWFSSDLPVSTQQLFSKTILWHPCEPTPSTLPVCDWISACWENPIVLLCPADMLNEQQVGCAPPWKAGRTEGRPN